MSKTIETAATFLVLIFVAVTVWAQYPKDETIDPYGMPVKDRILVQEFDCRGAAASQWKALHESRMIATESRVVVLSSGQDPYILMPGIAWPEGAPRTGTFELEIWMTNTMNPKGEIFWATETKPDFNADAATRFSYSKEDDTFVCVRFETDAPLTRLRFDPGMSEGVCELKRVRLKHVTFSDEKVNHTPEYDPNWADAVERWITISDGELSVQFDAEARGARIFRGKTHVGDVYPFAQLLESLPRADKPPQSAEGMHGWNQTIVPLERGWTPEEIAAVPENEKKEWEDNSFAGPPPFAQSERKNSIEYFRSGFLSYKPLESIEFWLENEELHFEIVGGFDTIYGPVFRPRGEMQQAVLCGVEYLEKGEHSSSTADIETEEHLRHAPKKLDVTWPFMAVVTDQIGFGLYWKDLDTSQPVFATPDFICGDPKSHYMGLHSEGDMAGTLKIKPNKLRKTNEETTDLEDLILWGLAKHGLPELPERPRDDERQRLLNLAAFETSMASGPTGWQHAATPGAVKQFFPMNYGNDFVSAIWQLSGKLPEMPRLDHGGGHLRNPASFFLMQKGDEFLDWTRNETRHLLSQQKDDGSFRYVGKYLKGHWDDTASGYCGNALYRLMENHRILGDPAILESVRKGLDFANRYAVPRGAQIWELSLHTPDIMGSSRMCMANVRYYEATGETKYLHAARRWAVTGLPFVYLWTSNSIEAAPEGSPEPIMRYATTPVFGATNYRAPNWIGLPVQWCGLDYGEALFMLAEHDKTVDWRKIAEGILIAAEQMQYPDGICVGLLPDSLTLDSQTRNPHDINPSVLVMQRRRLRGEVESVCVAITKDGKYRVVSPYQTTFATSDDGKVTAVIEGEAGTTYQILVNGGELKTVVSQGCDRVELP